MYGRTAPRLRRSDFGGLLLTEVSTLGEGTGLVLDATGFGAIGGVPLNIVSATAITAGAGMTATASGLLMQHAASDDAITPVRTGRSKPVGRRRRTT